MVDGGGEERGGGARGEEARAPLRLSSLEEEDDSLGDDTENNLPTRDEG